MPPKQRGSDCSLSIRLSGVLAHLYVLLYHTQVNTPPCLFHSYCHPSSWRFHRKTCINVVSDSCICHGTKHIIIVLQVPKKESLPSDEDLSKEVVSVLSGVDVLEFNIKMLMKHLSKLSWSWFCSVCSGQPSCVCIALCLQARPGGNIALLRTCLQMPSTRWI